MCLRKAGLSLEEELISRYSGSRFLVPFLPPKFFLRIDQANFIFAVLLTAIGAVFMRHALNPGHTPPWIRHLYAGSLGIGLAIFIYGQESIHLFLQMSLCWTIMSLAPGRWQHWIIFPLAMTYLSAVNIRRMFLDYGGAVVNVTGSMMILTQRMIMLSFSVYDGCERPPSELNKTQKLQRVRKTPDLLEMISYTFYFPAITSGPLFFFKDYEHFIVYGPPESKSCLLPVFRKIINGAIAMALNIIGGKKFNPKILGEEEFISKTNMDQKMIGCVTGLLLTKSKFYFAWSISDAMCNISGFGYKRPDFDKDDDLSSFVKMGGSSGICRVDSNTQSRGKDEHQDEDDLSQYKAVALSTCGSRRNCETRQNQNQDPTEASKVQWSPLETKDSTHQDWNQFDLELEEDELDDWEVTSNIRPMGIELAPNLRSVTDNWNIQTHNWIKYVCYDRCPASLSLTLSYVLIALWHGFYPGYWIAFVQATVLTKTSRLVRRVIRPLFLAQGERYNTPNPEMTLKKRYYDFLTWFATTVFVAYNMAPFFLLEFGSSVAFYASVKWSGHIVVGVAFVVLSIIDSQMSHETSANEDGASDSISADVIDEPEGGLEGFEGTWSASSVRCSAKPSRELPKKTE